MIDNIELAPAVTLKFFLPSPAIISTYIRSRHFHRIHALESVARDRDIMNRVGAVDQMPLPFGVLALRDHQNW